MVQRLAIIGFIIALVVAIFAFTQQQSAVQRAQIAGTEQASAQNDESTAVAMAGDAANAQAQAEIERDSALEIANEAATSQANAQATAGAAVDQANLAGTSQAASVATSGAQVTAALGTAGAESDRRATIQAAAESDMATANAQLEADATQEAFYLAALGTATAQVDLASFAALAAEDDRSQALDNAHAAATQVAQLENQLATAQFQLEGVPPRPTSLPTSALEPTAVPQENTPVPVTAAPDTPGGLNETFTTANGFISLNYPTGWLAGETEEGYIVIVTGQEVLTREEPALNPGQVEIDIYFGLGSRVTGLETGATVADVTASLMTTLTEGEDSAFVLGESADLTLGSRAAQRVEGSVIGNDLLMVVVELGDDVFAMALAIIPTGEIEQVEPVLLSILDSLQLNP